jgi:2-keto-4-pentenoate hydratase/2-oxohepta-3-ene-1,7-dioic acid hydratase in catechol pathway
MEFMRVLCSGDVRWVLLEDVGLSWIRGDLFGEWARAGEVSSLAGIKFLPPCAPTKIIAVGLNYLSHAKEMGSRLPSEPVLFLKPPSSVVGHRDDVVYPRHLSLEVDYEGELAAVIGKRGRGIPREEALEYVFGYTCANDVTARDLQRRDDQWTRAKGFDTFCPLGPAIATQVEAGRLMLTTRVNDQIRQRACTSEMIFPIEILVSHISEVMTLEAGDVILTGTPAGVGELRPGDVVEVEIEGVGTLTNRVVEA